MNLWIFIFAIGLNLFVLSKAEFTLNPCEVKDMQCLSKSTQDFLEKTSKGIPEHDIRPIDPLIIPSYTYEVDEDAGVYYHFNNINVTGLKSQTISDFQMNLETKSVELKLRADLHIVADATIELATDNNKRFTGVYTAISGVLSTAKYNYEFRKDDKDVEHFEIGPETLTCETVGEPDVSANKELIDAVSNDSSPIWKEGAEKSGTVNLKKTTLCNIVKLAYVDVIHNIRAAAKILPKTAFLKNV